MSTGQKPPAIDLVKVVKLEDGKVVLKGVNANEGYAVEIKRTGKSEYFLDGEEIEVHFEPKKKKD